MYSIPQAAEMLKKTRQQVWNLVQNGKLKAEVFEGGKRREYRIPEEALNELLEDIETIKLQKETV